MGNGGGADVDAMVVEREQCDMAREILARREVGLTVLLLVRHPVCAPADLAHHAHLGNVLEVHHTRYGIGPWTTRVPRP